MNWHAKPLTQQEIEVSRASVYPWGATRRAGAGSPPSYLPSQVFLTSPQALLTDFQRNHSTLGRLGQGLASVAPCWGWSRTPRGMDGGATEHVRRRSMLLGDGECTRPPWRVLSSSQRLENSSLG